MEAARRRVLATWLVSAPTARKTAAPATRVKEKYRDWARLKPTDGARPVSTVPAVVTTNNAASPTPRPAIAWAPPPSRVVWPARSSS